MMFWFTLLFLLVMTLRQIIADLRGLRRALGTPEVMTRTCAQTTQTEPPPTSNQQIVVARRGENYHYSRSRQGLGFADLDGVTVWDLCLHCARRGY